MENRLDTLHVDSEVYYEVFDSVNKFNYIQLTVIGMMPYNKDKKTVFNLTKENLQLLLKQLEK